MIQRIRMLYNFKGVVNVTMLTDVIRNDNYVFESIISVLMSSTPLNLTKLNSTKFGILVEPLECLDVFPCPAKFFFRIPRTQTGSGVLQAPVFVILYRKLEA